MYKDIQEVNVIVALYVGVYRSVLRVWDYATNCDKDM